MKKIVIFIVCIAAVLGVSSPAVAQTQEPCTSDYLENKIYVLHKSMMTSIMGAMKSLLDPFEKEKPPETSNDRSYCLLETFEVNKKNIRLYYHRVRRESDIYYVATVRDGENISYFLVQNVDELDETMEAPKKFPVKTIYSLAYLKENEAESISGFYGEPSSKVLKYMISLYLEGKPILYKSGAAMTIK
ncbi:MAG: hypothetical protein L3J50_08190 [Emcibacter sp.]|nr:hypothetical protein [Emcibacter sp.]